MPIIELHVKHCTTGRISTETYNIDGDPDAWATETIDSFNQTLRPGESRRELVKVVVLDQTEDVKKTHTWEKSNLVTKTSRTHGSHDTFRCTRCGITGKRFGLESGIHRDYRYRHRKFEHCQG